MTGRSWAMFALPRHNSDSPKFSAIGDFRFAQMHGGTPVPVIVTEDPDGDMLGWIDAGSDTPVMIEHKRIFDVQFPYGSKASVDRGHGRVVPLRVEAAPDGSIEAGQSTFPAKTGAAGEAALPQAAAQPVRRGFIPPQPEDSAVLG